MVDLPTDHITDHSLNQVTDWPIDHHGKHSSDYVPCLYWGHTDHDLANNHSTEITICCLNLPKMQQRIWQNSNIRFHLYVCMTLCSVLRPRTQTHTHIHNINEVHVGLICVCMWKNQKLTNVHIIIVLWKWHQKHRVIIIGVELEWNLTVRYFLDIGTRWQLPWWYWWSCYWFHFFHWQIYMKVLNSHAFVCSAEICGLKACNLNFV